MTLQRFQELLKKVDPRLRIRQRGWGDVAGLFAGLSGKSGYICRLTKGELHLQGFRWMVVDKKNKMRLVPGRIQKRGRATIVRLLKSWRWIKNEREKAMLMWGIGGEENE